MEDGGGFNDRVDKIFGSISSSKSLWSLSDAQIERKVWNKSNTNQRDDDQTPISSSFLHNNNGEDWDIRSCIGLDSTLDNEDEEDEFDKFAQGKEDNDDDDRLYMKDVKDAPILTQDDQHMFHVEQPPPPPSDAITKIKSILKRKCDDLAKPPKRVRFDPTCKPNDELPYAPLPQVSQGRSVPDYILNPSKYTRYDFHHNSIHVNDRSNKDIYFGFLEQLKKSKNVVDDQSSSAVLPKSILFIPRKKRGDAAVTCNTFKQQQSTAIGIAALEVQEQQVAEISEMQEQESHVSNKATRQYRTKMEEDDTVC